jgi:hypothetical protein
MNMAAREDLRIAWSNVQLILKDEADDKPEPIDTRISRLTTAVNKLCHVCAALDKDLTTHSNTQDAHNH